MLVKTKELVCWPPTNAPLRPFTVSVTTTSVMAAPPVFFTTMVYVSWSPIAALVGAEMLIDIGGGAAAARSVGMANVLARSKPAATTRTLKED